MEIESIGAGVESRWELSVSRRDAVLLRTAAKLLRGTREDMDEALRVLTEAVVSGIPNGRIYVLARGPAILLGSVVSGVGIAEAADSVVVERVDRAGTRAPLGRLRAAP